MFSHRRHSQLVQGFCKLLDQDSFYKTLMNDLRHAQRQVIIESPFMTVRRVQFLLPFLEKLKKQGVQVVVNTKPLSEHEPATVAQTADAIAMLQELGIRVLFTVGHRRKLVLIDDVIVYEGSLNVLSQYDSCEFMRRIYSSNAAIELKAFLRIDKYLS